VCVCLFVCVCACVYVRVCVCQDVANFETFRITLYILYPNLDINNRKDTIETHYLFTLLTYRRLECLRDSERCLCDNQIRLVSKGIVSVAM